MCAVTDGGITDFLQLTATAQVRCSNLLLARALAGNVFRLPSIAEARVEDWKTRGF
jgi:hypothetical protein